MESQTPAAIYKTSSHRFKVPAPKTPATFPLATHSLSDVRKADGTSNTPGPESTATPAPQRPHFILPAPPLSPVKPSKPLPEIFSPSRKTGRYIPDGLASSMTAFIIDCANTGYAVQERNASILWGRESREQDGVKIRMKVVVASNGKVEERSVARHDQEVECFPGNVTFVRGNSEPGLYNASRAPSTVSQEDEEMKVLLAGQGGARSASGIKIRPGSIIGIRTPTWEVEIKNEQWTVAVDWVLLS